MASASRAPGDAPRPAAVFQQQVRPILEAHCLDCHDADSGKGGLDLDRFADLDDVLADRQVWAAVHEKTESHQMPPPRREELPTEAERAAVLSWIEHIAGLPDPTLGVRDPGRPVLRRLNRLGYNNTVRDLFGLDRDIFPFPERLPIRPGAPDLGATRLPDHIEVNVREYGAKAPVLLPRAGLPGDNRAAHGFSNRGDAMSVTPLLLEKYVRLAEEIVQAPALPARSPSFARLLGIDPATLPRPAGPGRAGDPAGAVAAAGEYAPNHNVAGHPESDLTLEAFRAELTAGRARGTAGVFDVPAEMANREVAGKGGLVRVRFTPDSDKQLTINPDADLWLVPFATAAETSSGLLVANREKGKRDYTLSFDIRNAAPDERLRTVGVCVLARRDQRGPVTLTATFDGGGSKSRTLRFGPETGNLFVAFRAPLGRRVRTLRIDGSAFSGDYVLIDDIGFLTDGPARGAPTAKQRPEPEPPPEPDEPAGQAPRERLAAFLARALRRPPEPREIDRYLGVFESNLSQGLDEADAMRQAVRAVLASPGFLYLQELPATPPAGEARSPVRPVTDHELASRLSYFLWSSMPDDELRAAADAGRLTDPATREAEVRRMLRDPRARELSHSFAAQWLRLDQLHTAQPDRDLFPRFYRGAQGKDTLHASLLVEALLLFETVMIEDRSIIELIDADYTWLNPRLIAHYDLEAVAAPVVGSIAGGDAVATAGNRETPGIGSIKDNQWFRVPLDDRRRGGILTMGGPLTVTSLPFRTSPIKRGAWLLETVFNRPPTEPKVAFAIKDDTREAARGRSVRERFEAHRDKPACYSCHIRLDPPGFALEAYGPTGRWRDTDGAAAVDTRAEWKGVPFDGPAAFKTLLADEPHEFGRGFIEHLLSYALGRELGLHDLPTVMRIEQRARAEGWKFSRVVVETTQSYPFTHLRNGTAPRP